MAKIIKDGITQEVLEQDLYRYLRAGFTRVDDTKLYKLPDVGINNLVTGEDAEVAEKEKREIDERNARTEQAAILDNQSKLILEEKFEAGIEEDAAKEGVADG